MKILIRKSEHDVPTAFDPAAEGRIAEETPTTGTYLTDGDALYRVANMLCDRASGETFLELEDCSTLELVLCPARTASALRAVIPTV